MSQNNDQGRRNPSQPWYDNGDVPQSKKFPFGPGDGGVDQAPGPEAQNSTPAYGQPSVSDASSDDQQRTPAPSDPEYGEAGRAPRYDSAGQETWAAPEQSGQYGYPQDSGGGRHVERRADEYAAGGRYEQQSPHQEAAPGPAGGQPSYDSHPQQEGRPLYGSDENRQNSNDSGPQPFQGILDPHTGEIHPVPDLEGLQDTDALLVVVSGPDSGSQILLDTDVVTVGRSPNADIFLDDVTVSRKHAEFIRTPSGFTLRDTGSLNGTYVGRQLIDSIELQNGADVQIGKFRMIFQQRPRS